MSKFKVGDRVIYNKGGSDEDTGTILRDNAPMNNVWWVYWDKEEREFWVGESSIEHFEQPREDTTKEYSNELLFALKEVLQSLEYVHNAHPEVSGKLKAGMDIQRASDLISKIEGETK